MIMNMKQQKIKIEPRIKLNYNIAIFLAAGRLAHLM